MVQLSIVCTRGNAVRWYPVSGFLGMSEVQVTGIVRTRLEDDGRHLAGTCIDAAVRCYAERTGPGRNTIILAEYTATLWQKPPGRASEPIGDKDLPFTITVPKSCSAASTMNFQSYRVFWRVEATCHHLPMMGLGTRQLKSYELALVRYDSRRLPSAIATTPFQTTTTRGKKRQISVEHQIQLPNTPVGPLDIIPVTVRLRPFGDDGARVAALSLSVLRRLVFHDSPSTEDLFQRTRSENAHANSLFADHDDITPSGSDVTLLASASPANAPAPAPVTASSKSSVLVLATTEATSIGIDESDYHTKTLHVSLPPPKSLNHWALGETHSCALASISFHIAIKATIVLSSGNQEIIELPQVELIMNATNHGERQAMREKFPELFKPQSSRNKANTEPVRTGSRRPNTAKGERDRENTDPFERERERSRSTKDISGANRHARSRSRPRERSDKPKSAGAEEAPLPSASVPTTRPRKPRRPHTANGDATRRPLLDGNATASTDTTSLIRKSRDIPSATSPTTSLVAPQASSVPAPPNHTLQQRSGSHGSSTTSLAFPITPRSTSSVHLVDGAKLVTSPLDTIGPAYSHSSRNSAPSTPNDGEVEAWEKELVRIEGLSRQRSAQMGPSPARRSVAVDGAS